MSATSIFSSTMPFRKVVCPGIALKAFAREPRRLLHIKTFALTSQILCATLPSQPMAKPKIFFVKNTLANSVVLFLMQISKHFKAFHHCWVCDSTDHAMLTWAKHNYPIPSSQSSSSSTTSYTDADQSSWLHSLVDSSNEVRAFGLPDFLRAKHLVHSLSTLMFGLFI